jgi:hypothetical protein
MIDVDAHFTIRSWPSTPAERRLHQMLEQRRRRYGHELVPRPEVYSIIERVTGVAALGFVEVGARVWARRHDDQHTHVVQFQATKGNGIALMWGVCVPYVPTSLLPRPSWARTPKQTRLILWESSREVWPDNVPPPQGVVDTASGPRCVEDDAGLIWSAVRPRADAFWRGASDVEGVLATAEAQAVADLPLHGFKPHIAAAFALARLGRVDDALRRLTEAGGRIPPDYLRAARHAIRTHQR